MRFETRYHSSLTRKHPELLQPLPENHRIVVTNEQTIQQGGIHYTIVLDAHIAPLRAPLNEPAPDTHPAPTTPVQLTLDVLTAN